MGAYRQSDYDVVSCRIALFQELVKNSKPYFISDEEYFDIISRIYKNITGGYPALSGISKIYIASIDKEGNQIFVGKDWIHTVWNNIGRLIEVCIFLGMDLEKIYSK